MAWALILLPIVLFLDKSQTHLFVNQFHFPVLDHFFKYATFLGDGFIGGIVILMLLLFKYRYGIIAILSFGGSALTTQFLKRLVFDDHTRPITYFKEMAEFHLVDGVSMHTVYSFPSGHSTAAFSIFTVLALFSRNKTLQILCMITAMIAAFSRVYLSQHFLEDILAGSTIGFAWAFTSYLALQHKKWGENGLLRSIDQLN